MKLQKRKKEKSQYIYKRTMGVKRVRKHIIVQAYEMFMLYQGISYFRKYTHI